MKYYKLADDFYLEVAAEELAENCNAYKLKCARHVSRKSPDFSMGEDFFFIISVGGKARAVEIASEEFDQAVNLLTEEAWTEILKIQKEAGDNPFCLTPLSVSSRRSYQKTHNTDSAGFRSFIWELQGKLGER